MQHVIMAIHLMVVTALVALVLYQKSEGGALGLGQTGFFTGRGQANALTRATSILGTIFFITSIALTVLPAYERRTAGGGDWTTGIDQDKVQVKEVKPKGEADANKPTTIPQEKESIFDQLKRAQEKRQGGAEAEKPGLRPSVSEPAQPGAQPEVQTPKAEAPKSDTPKSDAPKVETPKSEAPASVTPKADADKPADAPKPAEAAPAPKAPTIWKTPTQ
jgi:protein translocase SecG subunit